MPAYENGKFAAQTRILEELYAAINRNDIPAALPYFDKEIERIEPEGFPAAKGIRGIAEFREHLVQARATWAEGNCQPEEFLYAGERMVALVHVRVKMKETMAWAEGRLADAFRFRNGKIVEMHTFIEKQKALDWAGIPAAE